jgi:hypothetical protein
MIRSGLPQLLPRAVDMTDMLRTGAAVVRPSLWRAAETARMDHPAMSRYGETFMRSLIVVVLGLGLCACGDGGQPSSSQDRIYDTQRQALEKAQDLNEKVMDAAQQLRSEEEQQAR